MTLPYENIVHMFCHVPEHQKICIIATVENREKHRLKQKQNKVQSVCICARKSAYCVRTKERGGHQREGGTSESDGFLYSVGVKFSANTEAKE